MSARLVPLAVLAGCDLLGAVRTPNFQENPISLDVELDDGTAEAWNREATTTWAGLPDVATMTITVPAEPDDRVPDLTFTALQHRPGMLVGEPISLGFGGQTYSGAATVRMTEVRWTGDASFPWLHTGRLEASDLRGSTNTITRLLGSFAVTGPRCGSGIGGHSDCGGAWERGAQSEGTVTAIEGDCPEPILDLFLDGSEPGGSATLTRGGDVDLGGPTALACVQTVVGDTQADRDLYTCGASVAGVDVDGCAWAATARLLAAPAEAPLMVTIQAGPVDCPDPAPASCRVDVVVDGAE